MTDRAAVLRLGLTPMLLLGWNAWAGAPLPFLASALLVPLLLAPARPRLAALGGMVALVGVLAAALSLAFLAVADSPASVWLALLALATACFARMDARPDDMPAFLALTVASIATALLVASPALTAALPSLMLTAIVQAVLALLIAHAILPSTVPPPPPRVPRALPPGEAFDALARGAALVAALMTAVAVEDTSAVLIAVTALAVLRAPAGEARGQGRGLLLGNLGAAALVLPALVLASVRPGSLVPLLLLLAAALWLSAGLAVGGIRARLVATAMPVFVTLAGLLLPKAGDGSLAALWDRLLTLGVTIALALLFLVLLRGRPAAAPA